jgi:hypothetical protein
MTKMHRNPYYLALLLTIVGAALFFGGKAGYKYYKYSVLTAQAPLKKVDWSIQEVSDEEFFVKADYLFEVNGVEFPNETVFKTKHLNHWAAEQALEEMKTYKNNKVWYQPGNEHHSTLQKNFPLKECVSAAALLALLLYFVWLGIYVVNYRT